jgi:hypothetical protein
LTLSRSFATPCRKILDETILKLFAQMGIIAQKRRVLTMTSAFSPPSDRKRAAEFLMPLLDGSYADARAVWDRADASPDGRFELTAGLALALLDELMLRYGGPVGAREQIVLTLLDPEVSDD